MKLYGTCLCITYILLDIFHCWAIIVHAEGYGAEDNDLWNGGGVLTCTIKLFLLIVFSLFHNNLLLLNIFFTMY